MKNDKFLNNIWELYGVKENPFSTSPILVLGGSLPIEPIMKWELLKIEKNYQKSIFSFDT